MAARVQITRAAAMMSLLIPSFVMAASSTVRLRVSAFLGWKRVPSWRTVALLLMLLNLKNMPWVWHFRVFKGIIYHLWFQPFQFPAKSLFKYMITTSHSPLWETDYNFHKSNSTYFSDADVARTHLVTAMLRRGIRGDGQKPGDESLVWSISSAGRHVDKKPITGGINPLGASGVESIEAKDAGLPRLGRDLTEEEFVTAARKPGNLVIALGSVACFFHREIPPYQQYEIWTRLLTWDKKWLYIVSYFVEPGAILPEEYVLQPRKKWFKRRKTRNPNESSEQRGKRLRRKIYATSIATYVVKKGRLTVPPEVVLQRSSLLPPKPADAPSVFYVPSVSTVTTTATHSENGCPNESAVPSLQAEATSSASLNTTVRDGIYYPSTLIKDDAEWTWDIVERERQRGLRFATMFDGLNALRDDLDMEQKSVLGRYPDLLFGI